MMKLCNMMNVVVFKEGECLEVLFYYIDRMLNMGR
jgi:hypothetical protein